MPLPNSLHAYSDCLDFFEQVVDDPKGGRVFIGEYAKAHYFRARCNQARKLHRIQNSKIHDPGTTMHGCSEYDPLCLQLKMDTENNWYVYAVRMKIDASQIDLLSETEDAPQITNQAPLQIEDMTDAKD